MLQSFRSSDRARKCASSSATPTGPQAPPTAAKTLSNFGLDGVDLGFPVDSSPGPLYFLFGDALPPGHPSNSILSVPPDDALGSTTRTAPPDSTTCLDLQLITSAPKTFAHPTVHPTIQQGTFNVPSGGVFLDNTFYAFFWTDHCVFPTGLMPEPHRPLAPNQQRTATIVCRTDCNVLELTESKAKQLYFQDRSFGFAVLQLIISRLIENNERLKQTEPASLVAFGIVAKTTAPVSVTGALQ